MDFQTLTRRELQSLCKLNKIPANITNVAMAEALQSLHTVVGIEEYLNVTQPETADVVQSVEVFSPQTRCRTSTRQKVKLTETETLQNRTDRRVPKEVEEESKNDSLKTPAVSRTTRNRLSECESEVLVENKYGTRRSTRLTEKKSRVKKGADSILDQGNSSAEVEEICKKLDVVVIEEEVNNPKQEESDEISNTCEDSLKISEVISISSAEVEEVNSPKDDLKKEDQVCDLKPESDEVCDDDVSNLNQELVVDWKNSEVKDDDLKPKLDEETQFEDENLAQKLEELGDDLMSAMKGRNSVTLKEEERCAEIDNVVMVQDGRESIFVGVAADSKMTNEVAEINDSTVVIIDNTENPIDEIITKEVEEMSENTVDETVDVTMAEEVEDLKPELFTENKMTQKSEADTGTTESPLPSSDVTGHPSHMTPIKSMTEEVEDRMFKVFTENNEKSDADLGLAQNQVPGNPGHVTPPLTNASGVVSDDKENNNVVEAKNMNIKKDKNDKKNANDMSIRQLKKLLKAMTLNSHNSKEEGDVVGTKRTALQAVCENQMVVGGENEN